LLNGEVLSTSQACSIHGSAASFRLFNAFVVLPDEAFLAFDWFFDAFLTFSNKAALAFLWFDRCFFTIKIDVVNVPQDSLRSIVPGISKVEVSFALRVSGSGSLNAFVILGGSGVLDTEFGTLDFDGDVGNLVDGELSRWVETEVSTGLGTGSDVESGGLGEEPNTGDPVLVATTVLVAGSDVKDVGPTGHLTLGHDVEVKLVVLSDVDHCDPFALLETSPFFADPWHNASKAVLRNVHYVNLDGKKAPVKPKKCKSGFVRKGKKCIKKPVKCKKGFVRKNNKCVKKPKACCRAMNATCLACTKNLTVKQYCAKNPKTAGCIPTRKGYKRVKKAFK
jgi:hypothetical protein